MMDRRDVVRAGVAVLVALMVAGCAADPGSGKPPSSATETSSGPTATTASVGSPVPPFGGNCDNVLPVAEAASIVGSDASASFSSADTEWRYPLESAGGLFCTWDGADEYLEVVSLPVGRVSSDLLDRYSKPECVALYDWSECASARERDGIWTLAVLRYGAEIPPVPTEMLDAVLNVAADQVGSFPAAEAVTPSSDTWTLPECETLAQELDLPMILGPSEIFAGLMTEGPGPLDRRIAASIGAVRECAWSTLEEPFKQLAILVEPDAGWSFAEQRARYAWSEQLDITGASSAARARDDEFSEEVLVTDTVNILRVQLTPSEGDADVATKTLQLMRSVN
jgi:hypothetical protein